MKQLFVDGVTPRGWTLLLVTVSLLLSAPLFINDYFITLFILIFYLAYVGQAWNIMMGFAGQLSLGHALFVGLGAYTAAILFIQFGLSPWVGAVVSIAISGAVAIVVGYLAFRFGIGGVYFAILTIAFAEFARIGFDHIPWLGAASGLFLPIAQYSDNDLWSLRGKPIMFYYITLVLMLVALLICRLLLRSRLGYYWLAIREDEQAACSLGIDVFRCKIYAVLISACMTSIAGVIFGFYYNSLFPEQVFSISRSIEIILGPIIGGIGTLIGPIIGAFVLTFVSEGMTELLIALNLTSPGSKHIIYGLALITVMLLMPPGVWPPIARVLGLVERSDDCEEP